MAMTSGLSYRIMVEGMLGEEWSERLGGMSIAHTNGEEGVRVTTLVGALADRSALLGILNTLHDLNLTLLSVEALDRE